MGVPRSILLGRPAPKPGKEPLWLEEDFDAILDYLAEEQITCSGCGLPRDETMDPKAEGKYVSKPIICHACRARETAQEHWSSGDPPGNMKGTQFTIEERRLVE